MSLPIDVDASAVIMVDHSTEIATSARNDSENDSLKNLESIIAERIATKTFPVVHPNEQDGETEERAMETLSLMEKEEGSALQNYIDEKWRIYFDDHPCDDSTTEGVHRARWSREYFYVHMRQFFEERQNVVLESLHEWIAKEKVSEELKLLTSELHAEAVEHVLKHIHDAWKKCLANLPEFARVDTNAARHAWFEKNCLEIMRSFEWPLKPFVFYPELDVEDIKEENERLIATELFNTVQENHVLSIVARVNNEFAQEMSIIPEYLREGLEYNLRKQFLLKEYVKIVKNVVDDRRSSDSFKFKPRIAPESIKDPKRHEEANELVKKVQECHVGKIEDLLLLRYKTAITGIDDTLLATIGKDIWSNFISTNYYNIVREIVGTVDATKMDEKVDIKRPMPSDSSVEVSEVNVFASPKKRAKMKTLANSNGTDLTTVTVSECHTRDSTASDAIVLKAAVMYYPDDLRWVDVTDRKTKQKQKVAVMNVLLADVSGPITLELWREPAESVFRLLCKWEEEGTNDTLWVEVSNVWIRGEKDRYIPSMRRLCANERTKVTHSTPMVLSSILPPGDDLQIDDFLQLMSMSPPFFVNATGVVVAVQDQTTSQTGMAMMAFRLQDQSGRYVMCTACGRHVDNVLLEEGNKVTLFFAKALSGLGGENGSLWMFDNSHIVLWRKDCMIPTGNTQVELR